MTRAERSSVPQGDRLVEDALAVLDAVTTHHGIAQARATLAAHIAAQDLTVQHLEGSCDVLRERIAAHEAEIARPQLRAVLEKFE